MQRVSQSVREQLAVILLSETKNPQLSMISITDVKMTPDLRQAHVYFNRIGAVGLLPEAQQLLQKSIQGASGFLRNALSQKLDIKYLPELHFHYDDQPEKGSRLRELIEKAITQDKLLRGDEEPAGPDQVNERDD
jgi:ribosome-binding factor A